MSTSGSAQADRHGVTQTRAVPTRTSLVIGGLVLALVALFAVQLYLERQREIERASRSLSNLAAVVAEHARQTFEDTDAALSVLVTVLTRLQAAPEDSRASMVDALSTARAVAPAVYEFFYVAETGQLVASSAGIPEEPLLLAHVESFGHHHAMNTAEAFVAEPGLDVVGRASGRQVIRMSRRVSRADGSFRGMVVAAMSVAPLRTLYESIALGDTGVVTLFRSDGLVLVRAPSEGPFGSTIARTAFFNEQIRGRASTVFDLVSPLDGVTRLTAFDRDEKDRILVTVGMSRAEILRDWTRRASIGMVAAILLLGLLGTVSRLDLRAARRREADAYELATRFRVLADTSASIGRARTTPEILKVVAEHARHLVPAHQAVASVTTGGSFAQAVQGVALSERYERYRTDDAAPDGTGLYRLVCERNEPMRLTQAELAAHPAWRGFGAHAAQHPALRGWLAVPLTASGGANLGLIQMSDRETGDFTADDQAMLQQLARLASASLENRRLAEEATAALAAAEVARFDAEKAGLDIERIFNTTSDAFYALDGDWRFTFANPQAERILGRSRATLQGRALLDEFPLLAGSTTHTHFQAAVREQVPREFRVHSKSLQRWLDYRVFPVEGGLSVYFRDVTTQVELDEQIRQAQKMEAVGQLTGGVAHDFNNLLTVILGSTDTLVDALAGDDDLRTYAEMAQSAAETAAELTQRLLAFSRRQALEPTATDVSALLRRLDALMRRTLGEHVETRLQLGAHVPRAMVDPSQLENAILNLAINARDAMPAGGTVLIETSHASLDEAFAASAHEVTPGDYVCIAVSDTGIGMPPDVLARAFEPFFTTKEVGKGSGLGLSMVYGFVRQSGGHVGIESTPGVGTTIRLYLPEAAGSDETHQLSEAPNEMPRGTEVVALVEDQDLVRRHVENTLRDLGYRVRSFPQGPDMLAALHDGFTPQILVTDVVLPGGMNGRELAESVARGLPHITVLYISGYTEGAMTHQGRLDAGVQLLHKPFRRVDLARRVRAVLDAGGKSADSL